MTPTEANIRLTQASLERLLTFLKSEPDYEGASCVEDDVFKLLIEVREVEKSHIPDSFVI